ncbi:MAG: trypsin-like peptidase domain-containing protein, partial [Planctomycetaceae bacterium]|nr:trypsin-like peptidase domain-containing protein [Planctomycetaceae bacterium]
MVLMRTIILLTAVLLPSAFAMPRAGAETDTARIVADPILQKRQQELKQAIAKVRNAVVGVSDGLGVGSGVVVSPDGIVLTASHVVDSPVRRRIQPPEVDRRVTITFPDGSEYPAEVLGKNRNADAAMLRITRQPPDGKPFPFAEMGRSAELYQGQECFAMGNPGGLQHDRPAPVRIGRILSVGHRTIVSDCSIVLGDSGGPLFDMQGRVIGIHSMITSIIIENRHVAIDCFHRDWDRFQDRSRWGRLQAFDNRLIESSFFGVRLKWTDFRAAVLQVVQDSPADKAGLRPGDVIRSINNQRFADRLDLGTLLSEIDDKEEIDVVVERENEPSTLRLTTGHQEEALEEQRERRRRRREGNADPDDVTAMREDEFAVQLSPHRPIGPYEKRAPDQLKLFRPSMQLVKDSVVAIKDGGPTVALGVVMSS